MSTWSFVGYIFLTFAVLTMLFMWGMIAMMIIADLQEWKDHDRS